MFPLFTTRCLHVRQDVRDPSGGSGNCGRECCPVNLPKWRLPRHLGIFYMPQIYDKGPTALFPYEGRRAKNFFALKNINYKYIKYWYLKNTIHVMFTKDGKPTAENPLSFPEQSQNLRSRLSQLSVWISWGGYCSRVPGSVVTVSIWSVRYWQRVDRVYSVTYW